MIPRKIHYCWFGENPIPEKDIRNIESWKRFCPDYEIIKWDESNYNINKIKFIKEAYDCKKYAFVSDYARLDIIYNNGGIYLDTDVEIIKSIDFLLNNSAFCGREKNGKIGLGLIFGSEPKLPIIKELMDYYNDKSFFDDSGNINLTPIGAYTHAVLEPKGLSKLNILQVIEELKIYPSTFFDPYDFYTGKPESKRALKNAYCIHHYNATWLEKDRHDYLESCRYIANRYGNFLYKTGFAQKFEDLIKSKNQVKKEKGSFFSFFWLLKSFFLLLLKNDKKNNNDGCEK